MTRFPFFQQLDQMDCGPTCLRMIVRHHGRVYSRDFLREKCSITREGVSLGGISDAAEAIGMNTLGVSVTFQSLRDEIPLPCIAHWRQRHFIVVYGVEKDTVHVADPGFGLIAYPVREFLDGWLTGTRDADEKKGLLLLLEPRPEFYEREDEDAPPREGIGFLFPYFRPFTSLFAQLGLGLFIGSALLLTFPFLTQALVERAINYQNMNLVYLLLLAQLMLFFTQSTVDLLRGWILLHVGSRINIALISDFLIKLDQADEAAGGVLRLQDDRRHPAARAGPSPRRVVPVYLDARHALRRVQRDAVRRHPRLLRPAYLRAVRRRLGAPLHEAARDSGVQAVRPGGWKPEQPGATVERHAGDARISLERLAEIHARENEEDARESKLIILPQRRDIRIDRVSFRYGGTTSPRVLDGVDLHIREGQVTAIVGASGSGKTTLLKLLLKFYKPSEGAIRVGGANLDEIGAAEWRRASVVMQDGYIFADTIARNITESGADELIDRDRCCARCAWRTSRNSSNRCRAATTPDWARRASRGQAVNVSAC
jgi:ABC-type bacteriocin/lantibiotic exporter with double-glycine peptidase domain